jgi:hypothetical protein
MRSRVSRSNLNVELRLGKSSFRGAVFKDNEES